MGELKKDHNTVSTKPAKSRLPIDLYKQISGDVWILFKNRHTEANGWEKFWDGVHELNEKYYGCPAYDFMQKLLKLYFDELKEV